MTAYVWQIKDRNTHLCLADGSQSCMYLVESDKAQIYLSEKSCKKAIRNVHRKVEMYKGWQEKWLEDPKSFRGGNSDDPFPGWEIYNDLTDESIFVKEVDLYPARYELVEINE